MSTPLTTIQSWPRPQLESAFTQREVQLQEALKKCAELNTELEKTRQANQYLEAACKQAIESMHSIAHTVADFANAQRDSLLLTIKQLRA